MNGAACIGLNDATLWNCNRPALQPARPLYPVGMEDSAPLRRHCWLYCIIVVMCKYLTPEEVAERLQLCTETIYRWLRIRKLKGSRLSPKVWRVSEDDLQAFMKRMREAR